MVVGWPWLRLDGSSRSNQRAPGKARVRFRIIYCIANCEIAYVRMLSSIKVTDVLMVQGQFRVRVVALRSQVTARKG